MEEARNDIQKENEQVETKKKRRKRRPIHEVTPENDIKYCGPLSYRHFRIIAWVLLALAQIGVLLKFKQRLYSDPNMYGVLPYIFTFLGDLMAPLFLIAAFATVLTAKGGYRKLIILYTGLSILMLAAFFIVYQHFVIGLLNALSPETGTSIADFLLYKISGNGFIAFNIFIDLLLCTLVTFFINYNPTNHFLGKKIIIFRLFVILPIAYEIASITLKMLSSTGAITLSPYFFPFLTTKAPVAFLIFIAMALFVKKRERSFLKKGKTYDDYKAFLDTNTNTFHFSVFLSIWIAVGAILDFIIFGIVSVFMVANMQVPEGMDEIAFAGEQIQLVYSWGFGQTAILIFIIPLVLLFNYRKTYQDKIIDIAIPVVGVAVLIIIYIEGGFEVIRWFLIDLHKNSDEDSAMIDDIENVIDVVKRR